MLHIAHPWLFLLALLPLLLRPLMPAYREARPALWVPFLARVQQVLGREGERGAARIRRRRIQWLLLSLSWLALVTALARPQWLGEPIVDEKPMRDLLVALDLSGSMDTEDFQADDGETTDRLAAAKQVLDEFLAGREGDRVGLVLFGSSAFVQVPFTADLDVVRELLGEAQVRMLGPRTVIGDAIGLSIRLFERSEVEEKVLIVLTDGNDTGSLVPPVRAAEIAADNGVVIHTIAMGDPEAAGEQALDEATLQAVADRTGGRFFRAQDRAELEQVYDVLADLNPRQVESRSYRPRHELFHWPLGLALVISLLLFGGSALAPATRGPEAVA